MSNTTNSNGQYNQLVWVDVETTGLVLGYHEIFEIHLIKGPHEKTIWLDVDLSKADPGALKVNHFYVRQEEGYRLHRMDPDAAAKLICEWTTECTLAGNNVGMFDSARIESFLRAHGRPPAWNHRVVDAIDYAAGALGIQYPWSSRSVATALGIPELTDAEAHTAAADARWARAIYERARFLTQKDAVAGRIEPTLAKALKTFGDAVDVRGLAGAAAQASLIVQPAQPQIPQQPQPVALKTG